MDNLEGSTLWRISAFQHAREAGRTCIFAGDHPTLLPTTLLADRQQLESDPVNGDVLEVIAACLRHREAAFGRRHSGSPVGGRDDCRAALVAANVCSEPPVPVLASNHTVQYNCHGSKVFITPLQQGLLDWLVPSLFIVHRWLVHAGTPQTLACLTRGQGRMHASSRKRPPIESWPASRRRLSAASGG